jgi:hypothetical protein
MSGRNWEFPEWQAPLRELIGESDRGRLPEVIQTVETLIFQRLQHPLRGALHHSEQQAIKEALSLLRTIKSNKLAFPDWE